MESHEKYVSDRYAIAVTAMTVADSLIYLGLTGRAKILCVFDTKTEKVELLRDIFPEASERGYCMKIHNAIGRLPDGSIVMGEGNHFTWDGLPVTVDYFRNELPESMLARKRAQGYSDVKYTDFCLENLDSYDRRATDPAGKIVRYYPKSGKLELVATLPPYLYVQSMCVDSERMRGFGHTIPDNHFFSVDFRTGILEDYGRISDYAHHNMTITPEGICYGGWLDKASNALKLLKFAPERRRLEYLDKTILPDIGPKIAGNQGIDQWIVTRSGRVFMGSVANAVLHEFDPNCESFRKITELGNGGRIAVMSEDSEGTLWIGAGYPHMRLFEFHPDTGKIRNRGVVCSQYERCYFHASCCIGKMLYLGETDSFSPSVHVIDLDQFKERIFS